MANLYIINLDSNPREKLAIQGIPLQLKVNPISNWAVIPSIGRNNPFYHYTGGEDELRFTIDWYSETIHRADVIEKCRWIESLSRNDSYVNRVPHLFLSWGDLFKFSKWVLIEAPYNLSVFEQGNNSLPILANQEIALKRITEQNTYTNEIRYNQ